MSIIDAAAYNYISDNYRFADICNAVLFRGQQLVNPDLLRDVDSKNILLAHGNEQNLKRKGLKDFQRFRDVIKSFSVKTDGNLTFMMVGIENQSYINYGMPLKVLQYDVDNYSSQVKQLIASRLEKGEYKTTDFPNSTNEFLGGLTKEDRLLPVITIVVYFGTEQWDAPTSFREMLGNCPDEILEWLPDYKYRLVSPYSLTEEESLKFHSDFPDIMEFIRLSKDKSRMKTLLLQIPKFRHLRIDAAQLLVACTKLDLEIDTNKEEIDMCQAFFDFKEEGRIEGRAEGRAEGGILMLYDLVLQQLLPLDVAITHSKLSADKFNAGLQAYAASSGDRS